MSVPERSALRAPCPWSPVASGAVIGVAVHLVGLDRWSAVPICAGLGGGLGSGLARLLARTRRHAA